MKQRLLGAAGLCLLLTACGGDSVPRHDVAGNVTYDGKPVPAGKIYFTPDAGKQNSGPQGVADIKDGKYDTRAGKGGPGGPVLVRVEIFDGKADAERPMGQMLYTAETKADLPKGASATQDFNLTPKDVKKVPPQTGPSP